MHHEKIAVIVRKIVGRMHFLTQRLEQQRIYTAQRLCISKACQILMTITLNPQKSLSSVKRSLQKTSDSEMISNFDQLDQAPAFNLIPGNIHRWTLRESHIVIEKIKLLASQQSNIRAIEAEILLNLSEQDMLDKNSKEEEIWQDMLKAQPDRQFHLGRITSYFS